MHKVDVELLIPLVEQRPVIWDRTLEIYKNKFLRRSAWHEVNAALWNNFDDMNKAERQEYGTLALRKWTQIRDSFLKDYKKRRNSSNLSTTVYKFADQLSFLEKVMRDDESENDEEEEEEKEGGGSVTSGEEWHDTVKIERIEQVNNKVAKNDNTHLKKKKRYDVDATMVKLVDNMNTQIQNEDSNRHLLFFKSILHHTLSFNDDETLEFQGGVISLIQSIKKQRQNKKQE